MEIAHKLTEVRRKIYQAAVTVGRDPKEVKLLAVSKTIQPSVIQEAYNFGQKDFAENRVQEWQKKSPALPEDCCWHIIGKLQTNKVKYLDQRVTLIHSLDRLSLLKQLEEQGASRNQVWYTLIQVNIARDTAKTGLMCEEVADFLTEIARYPHVRVHGLMTIGALEVNLQETRGFFRELRMLRDKLVKDLPKEISLKELSMGMSSDFEIAIEEGSTIVRVGRDIFGER